MTLWILLWGWGTVVSLDLISVGQVMIARPLVAGTVAGVILGDPLAGGMVGMLLELFALDVLPVGAVQYPDYGIASVTAAIIAADAPPILGLGLGVAIGLVVAYLGQLAIARVRALNSAEVRRTAPQLDGGDWNVVSRIHRRALGRELVRAAVVAVMGVSVGALVAQHPLITVRGAILLSVVMIGAAIGTAATGAMRLGGRGLGLRWFVLGLLGGLVVVML